MGGEFGAYILLKQPDTFKNYILGSPSLEDSSTNYLKNLEAKMATKHKNMNANVFVSIGELEKTVMDDIKAFASVLNRRAASGLSFTGLEIIENSDHASAVPETFSRSIKWLAQQSDNKS